MFAVRNKIELMEWHELNKMKMHNNLEKYGGLAGWRH